MGDRAPSAAAASGPSHSRPRPAGRPTMIARSPITAGGPVGTVAGWEVSTAPTAGVLDLSDLSPFAKVLVKGDSSSRAASVLACAFGRSRRTADGALVAGTGPDEWLVLAAAGERPSLLDEVQELAGAAAGELVTVVDVTHGGFLLRLAGADSHRLLEKICAIDLSEGTTPDGAVFRSSVARVVCDVIREDAAGIRCYLLHGDRTAGRYLWEAVLDAGAEFSIGAAGYVA